VSRGRSPRLREAGDSALLLELPAVIDPTINAHAIAIARAVRQAAIRGVRDVVSAYRSVAVFFDPLIADASAIADALHRAVDEPSHVEARRPVEIPVAYGGNDGPDLDDVARFARCTAQQVIERHASRSYRVFMLGFLPGFAYMGTVDDRIAAPRRPTPRLRVPTGSVGIAGRQTAIYPRESPGGWQIIGRTAARMFDPARTAPALLAPGDSVKFVPSKGLAGPDTSAAQSRGAAERVKPARSFSVLRPGLLSTIQDEGRWGHQHEGVSVSGPMDRVSHRLANALVGNPRDAAALEITLAGPELRFEADATIAIAGAEFEATVDGSAMTPDRAIRCRSGSVLRFGRTRAGARAYLAIDGGIEVPPVLGSRATHLPSGLGGFDGRAVHANDRVALGPSSRDAAVKAHRHGAISPHAPRSGGTRLRVLPGPQQESFTASALDAFWRTRFTITPHSDRMGYRLAAEPPIAAPPGEMISDMTFAGAVQMPPSGQPILLMADRQTTGGYPQIAIVISADLPAAGQLAPGDWVEFELCTPAQARAALVAQEGKLLAIG
jgi:KipI family sensor histidine kinase inhibitor